ncbi:MAG TPA: hypothetical protein VHN20_09140 [Beijerinckiaceae bacterium]|nr:hypothetical protein [Beijerinckiaceae bacterium]
MHLIQLLLPLYDNDGAALPRALFDKVREELSGRFGGLTAFTRAPAEGHWRAEGETRRDDIVIFEVMTERLDRDWWRGYRRELERSFRQEEIVIRAQDIELL